MEASSNLEHSSLIPFFLFFFFKQKTAYEMVMSDWSSDVCSSDLGPHVTAASGERIMFDAGVTRPCFRSSRVVTVIGRASCRERVFITV